MSIQVLPRRAKRLAALRIVVAGFLMGPMVVVAGTDDMVAVIVDQAKVIKLPEKVATIVVGNPLIAGARTPGLAASEQQRAMRLEDAYETIGRIANAVREVSGRRKGLKEFIASVLELLGPTGVYVIGGTLFGLSLVYLISRIRTPPHLHILQADRFSRPGPITLAIKYGTLAAVWGLALRIAL